MEKKITFPSPSEVDDLIRPLGLSVGKWNCLSRIDSASMKSVGFQASRNSDELYSLSLNISKYVYRDGWVFLHFDNSTYPTSSEMDMLNLVLSCSGAVWRFPENRSILISMDNEKSKHKSHAIISSIVFFCILFEWHMYIAGENMNNGSVIGVQDGFVYFYGGDVETGEAQNFIASIENNPLKIA